MLVVNKKTSCHKFKEIYESYEDFTLLKYQLSQNKMYNQTAIHYNYSTLSLWIEKMISELTSRAPLAAQIS